MRLGTLGSLGKLRIAQVAPLSESVPPKLYGGTERVVAVLTDELVRQGHDVTLFASGDSRTPATLVAPCRGRCAWPGASIRSRCTCCWSSRSRSAPTSSTSSTFTSRRCTSRWRVAWRLAHVTTLHGRLDLPDLVPLVRGVHRFAARLDLRCAARSRCPTRTGSARCITACRIASCTFHPEPGRYLAFLGRISPEKRVDRAIAIAKACGWPLKIAAKVDPDRRGLLQERRSSRCWTIRSSSSSARSPRRRRARFSAGARRCCSRSTGPSRSAW